MILRTLRYHPAALTKTDPTVIVHAAVIPAALRDAIEDDCRESDSSRQSVIVAILSERYGLPAERSGRYRGGSNPSADWVFQVPRALFDELRRAKTETGGAQERIILAALSEHYGLSAPAIQDQRGRGTRDEAGRWR